MIEKLKKLYMKSFVFILLIFFYSLCVVGQKPPNVIVIYTDDWGYADLSCQGVVKDVKTPHLDALAENGIRCTNGYVTAPQCSPSRAGLLTGRYQQRFDFESIADGPLPLSEKTIADRLTTAGYVTGQVGKWHLDPNPATLKWIRKNIPGAVPVNGLYNNIPDSMLLPYSPGVRGFAQYFTGPLNRYAVNYDLKGNVFNATYGKKITEPGYRLDIQTEAGLTFIQNNKTKPFFLYLAYFGTHTPLQATKKYLDRFPGYMPERRRYALAMIAAIDDGVGRIVASLKENGIYDNTIIVFSSDNGAPLDLIKEDLIPVNSPKGVWDGSLNDPMNGEKGMLTEGGIRVPFIISWSKLPKGKVYDKPVSTLDIAPTVMAAAGIKSDPSLDGVNLIPYLKGIKKGAPHANLYWTFWGQAAIRQGDWKYIMAGDKDSYLFNLNNDPGEKNDLLAQNKIKANELNNKLLSWLKATMPKETYPKKLTKKEERWYDYYLNNKGNNLAVDFKNPPDSIKPAVYWYWINDNISREGITKDLESMAEVGIGEAFIGNIGLPQGMYGNVKALSEEWWQLMEHAIREGKRVGVDIGIFNSPGWSQSGGPWVKPSEAMRYLVSSDTLVQGGKLINTHLRIPKDTFQDLKVLAFPAPRDDSRNFKNLKPIILINDQAINNGDQLIDGNVKTSLSMPVSNGKITVNIRLNQPYSSRSLLIYPSSMRFRSRVQLSRLSDGVFIPVREFILDRSSENMGVGPMPEAPVSISFDAVEAAEYRLVFNNLSITGAAKDALALSEIALLSNPRLEHFIEKQLGMMHPTPLPYWKEYQWTTQPENWPRDLNTKSTEVIDISDKMRPDGSLQWDAPSGNWIITRIGLSTTGTKNHPTSPQAEGLEVDKMNKQYLANHFNAYIGELIRRMPAKDRTAFKHVVADSYEMGPENWTEGFREDFIKKYKYDPLPFLPVINGNIINSADESDRFLWDLRRLIADKIAYDYVGGLRELCEKNGMRVWLENYGHWGFPSEFLMYGGQSHDLGGEFWVEGILGNVECKAASSAAHIYGHNKVYAESYTAAGKLFERDPAYLKKRGDWSFTEGINQVLLHVYIHQPYEDKFPGMNAWFGTEFNRKNTWFKQAKSWFDYQRRCMVMLQHGKPVVDVCYFIGEDAPKMTGIRQPELPKGYSYDYINAEVILNRLRVKDGLLVLPDGLSFRMMVLPPLKTMRPELLEKISKLVKEGAVILGPRPVKSPSLQNYPNADKQVGLMANELWGELDGKNKKWRNFGKGLVMEGLDMQEAFNKIEHAKDFEVGEKVPVLFTHRKSGNTDVYFITNQSDSSFECNAIFRVIGKRPELWDATSGEIRLLTEYNFKLGRTEIPLELAPAQSYFIVFKEMDEQKKYNSTTNFPEGKPVTELKGPWKVTFDNKARGPQKPLIFNSLIDWTTSKNDSIKYFSGTAIYETTFKIDKKETGKYILNLGKVKNLATISINGKVAGGLWTMPWQLDISSFVKMGENTISVEVVNLWVNRLIGDAGLPEKERKTWLHDNRITPTDLLHASGLLGPVNIKVIP